MEIRQEMNWVLKDQILESQNRIKQIADTKKTEEAFQEGYMLLVKFLYKNPMVAVQRCLQLTPNSIGHKVEKRVERVA